MKESPFIVTFHERAVVTELVYANSKADAIRRVKDGRGDRVGFEIDQSRYPTGFSAAEDRGSE